MHVSIPDTQECFEHIGSTYVGYNIHINGEYHCTVRYKQLHSLNEQLKKLHGSDNIPPFPPKKYWPLTQNQLDERRAQLEKYVQAVGQNSLLMSTDIFNVFLLTAQQESCEDQIKDVDIDVYLMNGYKVTVNVSSNDSSDAVLKRLCSCMNLPLAYMYYFALFLINKEDNGDLTMVRRLKEFESPYISQKSIQGSHKIMLRKSYWDPSFDLELMDDRVALNLLYVQTVSDIDRGWIVCDKEIQEQLATLQARGAKREYLDLARTLKYYNYVQFRECKCDFPVPNSKVIVSVGSKELSIRLNSHNGDLEEGNFKITRMRCWRITTHNTYIEADDTNNLLRKDPYLELSFEYLMARDKLEFITISSEQAILMSVCLQSIVDELLLKKAGLKIKQPEANNKTGTFSYMKRDGSSQCISISQSSSTDTLSSSSADMKSPTRPEPTMSMRKLSEKLGKISMKPKPQPLVENDAFEGIGDDDL